MRVLKTCGHIVGAELTKTEEKALMIEGDKVVAKLLDEAKTEINAAILWALHVNEHWGPTKLRRFYEDFQKPTKEIIDRYLMGKEDAGFLNVEILKEYGIDIRAWEKEIKDGGLE